MNFYGKYARTFKDEWGLRFQKLMKFSLENEPTSLFSPRSSSIEGGLWYFVFFIEVKYTLKRLMLFSTNPHFHVYTYTWKIYLILLVRLIQRCVSALPNLCGDICLSNPNKLPALNSDQDNLHSI